MVLCRVTLVCLGVPDGVVLYRVTFACICVRNDSVDLFRRRGTDMNAMRAWFGLSESHVRTFIMEIKQNGLDVNAKCLLCEWPVRESRCLKA